MAAIPAASWPTLSFEFHPAVQVIDLWWNTLPRWRAVKQEDSVPAPERLPQRLACAVWRNRPETRYRGLDPLEAVTLRTALAGEAFAVMCGQLAAEMADPAQVPLLAAGFLKTWLNAGLIRGLQV